MKIAASAHLSLTRALHVNVRMDSAAGTLSPTAVPSPEQRLAPHISPPTSESDRAARTRFPWRIALPVSLLLVLPCFWQSRIQSIDLSSHIYNAWLASLISHNQAPGLWIAHQSNNVLFDFMLAWLLPHLGAAVAQKIAVAISVLIFSWGAILLISRGRPRNWSFLLPSVAVLSYGFIFHAGFFNFYLGLGICFWYLAFFLSGTAKIRCLITPLLLLAWIAHPLPVVWAAGLAAYTLVAERLPSPARVVLVGAGVVALLAAHFLLLLRYRCVWSMGQAWLVTGAHQLLLFDRKSAIPFVLLLAAWVLLFFRSIRSRPWRSILADLHFQLWLLTAVAVAFVPSAIAFPQYALPFSFISSRLSMAAGVLLCALLVDLQLRRLEKTVLLLSATIFFALVFYDARVLNRIEGQLDAAVAQLPANVRVLGSLETPSMGMNPLLHTLDRACIGHCFSYANYEPASRQFRVRAAAGNPIVMTDYADVSAVELRRYRVQAHDLPVVLVYSCGPQNQQVCSRDLHEGEVAAASPGSKP